MYIGQGQGNLFNSSHESKLLYHTLVMGTSSDTSEIFHPRQVKGGGGERKDFCHDIPTQEAVLPYPEAVLAREDMGELFKCFF